MAKRETKKAFQREGPEEKHLTTAAVQGVENISLVWEDFKWVGRQ